MAYDLEEQEQIATLKAWWNKYGSLVTWLLIAVLAAYTSWNGWKYYQHRQTTQAGQLYEELQKAVAAGDRTRVQRAAADMTERYGRTAYAPMAAFMAARAAFEANDLNAAKTHLQWIIANAANEQYQAIARVRLAGVLLDEKAPEEALKVLSAKVPDQFAGLVADRRGDVLVAMEKLPEARAAYQLALEKTDQNNPARNMIHLKLDAIGGAPVTPAA
jgi:predicted negative regulator of RcsB-dependent stress response